MPKKKYKWKRPDPRNIQDRKNFNSSLRDWIYKGYPQFKPEKDKEEQVVRLCPPTWKEPRFDEIGHIHWAFWLFTHYRIGDDNSAYICLTSIDKFLRRPNVMDMGLIDFLDLNGIDHDITEIRCKMCEDRIKLIKRGDIEIVKANDAYDVGDGPVVLVISRKNEKQGPMWWNMPLTVEQSLVTKLNKKIGSKIFIQDPEEGYDFMFDTVTKPGKDGRERNTYGEIELLDEPSPLHSSQKKMEEWMDMIYNTSIVEAINWFSAEHIEGVWKGTNVKPAQESSSDESTEKDEGSNETEVEEETTETEVEDDEGEDIDYEYLMEQDEDMLIDTAKDIPIRNKQIALCDTKEELVSLICTKLGIEMPEEEEEPEEEAKEVYSEREKAKEKAVVKASEAESKIGSLKSKLAKKKATGRLKRE